MLTAILFVEAVPGSSRRRGGNRNAAFAFLLHPVHRGSTFVHGTDLVGDTRVEPDALGRRRLTGVVCAP